MSRYDDIINLPHHVSKSRKPMPLENRAAQFAPFAALSGHDEAIAETARLTAPKEILSQDEAENLSGRLACVIRHIPEQSEWSFVYYVPDNVKDGGRYVTVTGVVKRYDEYEKTIVLADGQVLRIDNIMSVSGKALENCCL